MRRLPRKIWRLLAITWSEILQYRADVFLWTLAEAITPLVALAIWFRVSQSGLGPLSPRDTLTYYIMFMFVQSTTNAWNGFLLGREILKGEIVKRMVQPMSPFWYHVAENISVKSIRLLLPTVILAGLLIFAPHIFSPQIFSWGRVLLCAASVLLAFGVSFSLEMIFGLLAFWVEDVFQIHSFKFIFQDVASGLLIPFAVMPDLAKAIFSILPFRYIVSAPVEILLGQASGAGIAGLFAAQVVWIVVLTMAARVMWIHGRKVYAIPGQ